MTYDTTPLERDCVILNCSKPAVDPSRNRVHCAQHDPDPPKPRIHGQDPDTQELFAPSAPDLSTMEPVYEGGQWVLKPKVTTSPRVERQELVDLLHRLEASVTAVRGWLE